MPRRPLRIFCHQNVLEEVLQALVAANGVFHCVNFQEGEGFFGMHVHRRCTLGVDIGLFLGGRRIGFVLLPLFRVQSSILQGFHLADIQRFQRPEADVCAVDRRLTPPRDEYSGSTRTDSVGSASIAPSFPSFTNSSPQKGLRLSKRLFEKSRDACWDKSCRLEGSSEQLLSLAIHLTWNSIWWQRHRDVNLRICTNSLKLRARLRSKATAQDMLSVIQIIRRISGGCSAHTINCKPRKRARASHNRMS